MPLYEYQCEACTQRFERIQKFSDPPVETCPACGGKVRKLLSSPAIQFKGSGWYITDYAKKSGDKPSSDKAEKKSETPSGSDAASSSSSGSADKPASTPTASQTPVKTTKSE
jgi:putative FmdB family regulatory protein